MVEEESISSTFYEQLLRASFFDKTKQTKNVSRKKLLGTLLYKKLLVKS